MKRVQLRRMAAVLMLTLGLATSSTSAGKHAPNQPKPPKNPPPQHGGGSSQKPPNQQPPPSVGSFPYPTASTVSQLIADINFANSVGGTFTITLAPGATFILNSAEMWIGGTKAVNLTIIGNGDTIKREGPGIFRLFAVAAGSALTLDQVTVQGFESISLGGAIVNAGTLTLRNGTALIGNQAQRGGGIGNNGGRVTISDSILADNIATPFYGSGGEGGGIANYGGSVTVSNSTLADNEAVTGGGMCIYSGTVTISGSTLTGNAVYAYSDIGGWCPGIFNGGGTVTVENFSLLADSYNDNRSELYLDSTSELDVLYGNPAIPF